jgi:choice-of-anchor C domain-containing protein
MLAFSGLDQSLWGAALDNVSVSSTNSSSFSTSDNIPPDTTLTSTPLAQSDSSSATFNFQGTDNVGGSGIDHFEASLDGAAFAFVNNGIAYVNLSAGSHTFAVRAVDAAGNVDPTPVTYSWNINPASGGNLLINGSFELGPDAGQFASLDAGSMALTGWTITRGNIDDIAAFWQAADGQHSLDMNGSTAGTIAQTFATTPGQVYEVTFNLAGNPTDPNTSIHGVHVSAAAQSQDFHIDSTGRSQADMGWTPESFQFTATDTSTMLAFSGLDQSLWGAALDNVSVNAFSITPT